MDWGALAGAIANTQNGILNFISQGITQYQNRESQHEINDLNRELAAQANQWSIDQWNRENNYNLPSAQRQRLVDAGLNPAIIYGNGLMNEAAQSPSVQMSQAEAYRASAPQLNIDPLTFSQIEKTRAETQAIEDANARENEKQPITLEQMSADLDQCKAKTDEILQLIKNHKMDEQIKSVEYLRSSLDYQFASATFNDAVESYKTTLSNLKKVGRQADFDYNRSLQLLSYEVIGFDLKNRRERALLNIDYQTWRQNEELFDSLKRKYFWDANNSMARYFNTWADTDVKHSQHDLNVKDWDLKTLEFWINARNNTHAFQAYQSATGFDGSKHLFADPVAEWFSGLADTWRHGINIPISIGFK